MGDVITLVVNMNKKGFERGCTELRGAINSLSGTAKKMADGMKGVIPSIIGVGSAFGILTKAASTFMSQNVALTRQMEAVWTALGNLIGPLVERLVSWVVTAVSYLISFLNLLGITSKTASQLSKKAQGATGDLQKTIAGFDELNVLQQNQGASLPNLDPKEWMSELADLLKAGEFAEAGRYLAAKLNEMIENIDWVGIGKKLAYCFKGAIDFLGNFIRDFDAHRLGELVATMINQILNIDTSSEDTWRNLGEILVAKFTLVFDFLTGFLEELDTTALAKAVSGTIIGALEAISDSIATADWKKIGQNIANFFEKIDWKGIAEAAWEAFTTALSAASDLWDGLPDWLQDVALGVAAIKIASEGIVFFNNLSTALQTIMNLDAVGFFGKLGEVISIVATGAGTLHEAMTLVFGTIGTAIAGVGSIISGAVMAVVNFFDMLKEGFSWLNEILMVIGIALAAVGAVILGAPALITAVIAAIIAAVATAIVVIKQNWESIKKWFGDTCTAIGQFFSELWTGVVTFATDAWTNIGTLASNCISGLQNGWSNFRTFILNMWNGIVGGVKGCINSIIGCVNGMIAGVVSGVNAVSSTLNRIRIDIPSWVPGIGGATLGFNMPIFSAPQIPYLEKGGVLKKGQVGILEGKGGEAVVPLERNTEWINKMADAFMARVLAGNYDLTGNAKTLAALEAIAERVSYRTPTVAKGEILPYNVDTPKNGGSGLDDALTIEVLQQILEKLELLEDIAALLDNMQFVADFGDNIRALARKITKEQKRDKIAEGR